MKKDNVELDNEFYFLQGTKKKKTFYKRPLFWIVLILVLLCLVVVVFRAYQNHRWKNHPPETICKKYKEYVEPDYDIDYAEEECAVVEESAFDEPIYRSEVLVNMTKVNGFSLRIFTLPEEDVSLQVGPVDVDDPSIVLAVRAADIRADNGGIVGTFIDNGKLLSQGVSKKGYCAIIEGKVYIGATENTPYMEEALNHNGYFFRQYPLVVDGMAIDNKPKGRSVRRALCEKGGEILVVECSNISFHDFAQTLVEYGVENAIYLVGSDSYGFFRNVNNVRYDFGNPDRNKETNLTYIICR
ncbi:MAG: hypothetical protein CW341_09180 [Bacteroidetes bacterium]|nr:hypothetical protein [Bacteroidota bacterium]